MSEYLGIYKGSVVNNNDPERRGRVILNVPQILGGNNSAWCEPLWPTVYTPKVAEVVWLHFANGDINKPVYFSSEAITAEKIVAGSIDADRIKTNTILAADLNLTGSLTATGVDFRSAKFSGAGIFMYEPDGTTPVVEWPTNPALPMRYYGDAQIKNLRILETLQIDSDTSIISPGSNLNLAAGVAPPVQYPIPTMDWDRDSMTSIAVPNGSGLYATCQPVGMAYDSAGNLHSLIQTNGSFTGTATRPQTSKHTFPANGGAQTSVSIPHPTIYPHDLCFDASGNTWYLGRNEANGYIRIICDGITNTEIAANYLGRGIDYYDGHIYVMYVDTTAGNQLRIMKRSATTGALVATLTSSVTFATTWGVNQYTDPGWGLAVGTFDYGALRFVLLDMAQKKFRTFTLAGTVLTEQTNESWPFDPGTEDSTALYHFSFAYKPDTGDGVSGFRSTGIEDANFGDGITYDPISISTKKVSRYTSNKWTTESSKWWVSYTFKDTYDVTSGDGLNPHETEQGRRTSLTMSKRARLSLTAPVMPEKTGPDFPDSVRFYVGRGTTDPGRTGMWLNGSPAVGVDNSLVLASVFSGTNPPNPLSNPQAFPTDLAGALTSTDLREDGTPKVNIRGTGVSNIDGLIPPGSVQMFAGATIPAGWLKCDGATLTEAAYPDLFAAIGTTYGTGGAGTFKVPNTVDYFPVGASGSKPLGTAGGAATHTHGVSITTSTFTHSQATTTTGGGTLNRLTNPTGHDHTVNGNTGAGSTIPPYLPFNFMIKT